MFALRHPGLALGLLAASLAAGGCAALRPSPEIPPLVWLTPAADTPAAAPAVTEQPTTGPDCTNDARFVEDLTVPDGVVVAPGETLDKRWAVLNAGTCDWGPDYRLAPLDTGGFGLAEPIALYPARAGEPAVWQVQLRAPVEPGEHVSRWQAVAPDGLPFGDEVYLLVQVGTPAP